MIFGIVNEIDTVYERDKRILGISITLTKVDQNYIVYDPKNGA
jgi:hypothetical protein